jgi:NTE family protein
MAALLDVRFAKGGLIDGARIEALLAERGVTGPIERCSIPFAAVAADIESGAEVILRKGPIERAVRASIGLPGIFAPVEMDGQWLMDGGLVNPLPVSTCRSLGANVVIAVDVNSSRLWRGHTAAKPSILARRRGGRPTSIDALAKAVTILQVQLTLARLASEPAEHVLVPDLNDVGPFQFERAREAIAEGRACVQRSAQALRALVA